MQENLVLRKLIKKIRENRKSTNLDLSNQNIVDDELEDIINCARSFNRNIETLILDDNKITDKGAIILGNILKEFPNLLEISIQFNDIGHDGAIALFSLKNEFTDLTIYFHGNQIIDVGEMEDIKQIASARKTPE